MWSSVEHGGETIVTFADLLNLIPILGVAEFV